MSFFDIHTLLAQLKKNKLNLTNLTHEHFDGLKASPDSKMSVCSGLDQIEDFLLSSAAPMTIHSGSYLGNSSNNTSRFMGPPLGIKLDFLPIFTVSLRVIAIKTLS